MKYLLDTHVLIWWALEPAKLSGKIFNVLESPENRLFFSIGSIWEMQIKIQLGKLMLPLPLAELIQMQERLNDIEILPVEQGHIYFLEKLPLHHKDPFDRILIAQSLLNDLILISRDAAFSKYPVTVFWH
ncbi:MAG: type II toxin-antitoxin system VapC family toxin [Desulfococcaceae bacterium]